MASLGRKLPRQQTDDVQLAQPLTIRDVALAARHVLHMSRIDEVYLESTGLQNLVDGNPVDPCRFHGDAGDATRGQPVGEAQQITGEGAERLHGGGIAIGRHGHVVLRRSAVDTRRIRIDALEHRQARLTTASFVFHGRLLHTRQEHPGTGRRRREHSPKRDHGRLTARVTNDAAVPPQATLAIGLIGTSDGSASVPGCLCHPTRATPGPVAAASFCFNASRSDRVSRWQGAKSEHIGHM